MPAEFSLSPAWETLLAPELTFPNKAPLSGRAQACGVALSSLLVTPDFYRCHHQEPSEEPPSDFVWKVIKNKQILESRGKTLSKRKLGSGNSPDPAGAGLESPHAREAEAELWEGWMEARAGFSLRWSCSGEGFPGHLSFPHGQSRQRAAGDALGTLCSPRGAAPEHPWLGPGQGDACPLLVPTLGHLLKNPTVLA